MITRTLILLLCAFQLSAAVKVGNVEVATRSSFDSATNSIYGSIDVNPAWFGATFDGITDDSVAINSAITYVNSIGGGTIRFPAGVGKLNSQITIPAGAKIAFKGAGIGITELNGESGPSSDLITGSGTVTSIPTLFSNLVRGGTNIVFSGSHGLSVGDWISVQNTADYSWTGTAARPYYGAGEYFVVSTVPTSTNVTVASPSYDTYATGGTIACWKVNPITVSFSDMSLKFRQGIGAGKAGLRLGFSRNSKLMNVALSGSQYAQAYVNLCLDFTADNCTFFDNQASIGENYGIAIQGQKIRLSNLSGSTTRHLVTFGAGAQGSGAGNPLDAGCVNRDITITGGNYGTVGTAWAIDFTHGYCEHFTITGVTAVGGISAGGDHGVIVGNDLGNWNGNGTALVLSAESVGLNFTIAENHVRAIRAFDNGLFSLFARTNVSRRSQLVVEHNTFNCDDFTSSTYPTGGSWAIRAGITGGSPLTTNIAMIINRNVFNTGSTVAGPTYLASFSIPSTFGLKTLIMQGNICEKGGIQLSENVMETYLENNIILDSLQYGIQLPVTASPSYTDQKYYLRNNTVMRSQLDNINLVGLTNTCSFFTINNFSANAGQAGGGSYYSYVVSGWNRHWITGNYFGDDQSTATQAGIDSMTTGTYLFDGLNQNIGLGLNALNGAHSTIQADIGAQMVIGRMGLAPTNTPIYVRQDVNVATVMQFQNQNSGSAAAILANFASSSGSGAVGSWPSNYGTPSRRDKMGIIMNSDATALILEAISSGQTIDQYASGSTQTEQATLTSFIYGSGVTNISMNGILIGKGTGSPENNFTAPVGSQFIRTDGGALTSLYIKESGSGNTGWIGK